MNAGNIDHLCCLLHGEGKLSLPTYWLCHFHWSNRIAALLSFFSGQWPTPSR